MSQVRIELVGRQPLLMHNVQLADPDNPTVRAIAETTSKKKKTEDDRRVVARFEWFGGLYLAPGIDGPAMPTANVRKALIEGGRITKQGPQIERGVAFDALFVPLAYQGPRDLDALYETGDFVDRSIVGVQRSKVVRVRPRFNQWAVVVDAFVEDDIISTGDLAAIASRAGRSVGLGDNRKNGFGRFDATVKIATEV